MNVEPGKLFWFDYGEVPRCVHGRIALVHVVGDWWIGVSPDGDVYEERYSDDDPDVAFIWPASRAGGGPPGVAARHLYGFAPLKAADLHQYFTEAAAYRVQFLAALGPAAGAGGGAGGGLLVPGAMPAAAPAGGAAGGGPGAAAAGLVAAAMHAGGVAGHAVPLPLPGIGGGAAAAGGGVAGGGAVLGGPGAGAAVAPGAGLGAGVPAGAGAGGGAAPGAAALGAPGGGAGDPLGAGAAPAVGGGLAAMAGGLGIGAGAFAADGAGTPADVRVLPVAYDSTGTRRRTFESAVALITEDEFADYPIKGPRTLGRTLGWGLRFMLEHGGTPNGWHRKWKSEMKLQSTDGGVEQHDSACRLLEFATTYDQLNLGNLAWGEACMREVMVAGERYKDRAIGSGDAQGVARLNEKNLFLGQEQRQALCIHPGLIEYIGKEMAKEALVLKERRKAREERALLRPDPKAK